MHSGIQQCSCQCSEPIAILLCDVDQSELSSIVEFLHTGQIRVSGETQFAKLYTLLTKTLGFPKEMATSSGRDLESLRLGYCTLLDCNETVLLKDLFTHYKTEIEAELEKCSSESDLKHKTCIVCKEKFNNFEEKVKLKGVTVHYENHFGDIKNFILKEVFFLVFSACGGICTGNSMPILTAYFPLLA